MDDKLNTDLVKIEKCGHANTVELNARKTQCCLLSHKRSWSKHLFGRNGDCEIGDS